MDVYELHWKEEVPSSWYRLHEMHVFKMFGDNNPHNSCNWILETSDMLTNVDGNIHVALQEMKAKFEFHNLGPPPQLEKQQIGISNPVTDSPISEEEVDEAVKCLKVYKVLGWNEFYYHKCSCIIKLPLVQLQTDSCKCSLLSGK